MDYVEAFKNLRTNNKWGRKSPHKAVLMLSVIELYEQNILTDNEIFYDEKLKSMFLKVWNRVLPNEPLFHSEAYLPFWYLQNDSFWHIVPNRDKEDILALMRDTNIKPSEAKLNDSVRCAELDEDLYFLMTISSGRSLLKRVLLETYTTLSEEQIDRMSESADNIIDHSVEALSEYENILSQGKKEEEVLPKEANDELIRQFKKLNEDLQIVLNLEYYSFLKKHRNERDMMRDICPTVYALLDKITEHPIGRREIVPSFLFVYDDFLSNLKISLMSEDNATTLIDQLSVAINMLREEASIAISSDKESVKRIDRFETRILSPNQIDNDNIINDLDAFVLSNSSTVNGFTIKNGRYRSEILNDLGNRVFVDDGKFKIISGKIYRFNLKPACFTVKEMVKNGPVWMKGKTILTAFSKSALYEAIDVDYVEDIDDINRKPTRIQYKGRWYNVNGDIIINGNQNLETRESSISDVENVVLTRELIEAARTPNGGFTKSQLAAIGIEWPAPTDWIEETVGMKITKSQLERFNQIEYIAKPKKMSFFSRRERTYRDVAYDAQERRRMEAVLDALRHFEKPATPRDIARTVSRSAWGGVIIEESVDTILKRMPEVEYVPWGKYKLKDVL